jgi:hypothetical protein
MIMDYSKLIGKRVKLLAVFSNENKEPIFYECVVRSYDASGGVLEIVDKYGRQVFIDSNSIRQVMII